jgi:hypothetical protein
MNSEQPKKNTDTEIWRETVGDYYAPSIYKTINNKIGVNVGGTCIEADVREIHGALAIVNGLKTTATQPSQLETLVRRIEKKDKAIKVAIIVLLNHYPKDFEAIFSTTDLNQMLVDTKDVMEESLSVEEIIKEGLFA